MAEVSLELLDPPDSTSQELGLQVYTATPSSFYFLESQFFPLIHAMTLASMTRTAMTSVNTIEPILLGAQHMRMP